MDDVHQVTEVAAQTVELPYDKGVTGAKCLQTVFETWSVIALSAGGVVVEVALRDARSEEGVGLKVKHLRPIGF